MPQKIHLAPLEETINDPTTPWWIRLNLQQRTECDTPDCSDEPEWFVFLPSDMTYGVKCQSCHEDGVKEALEVLA